MSDLYSTLDVPPTATPDQIKRAFRKKAKSAHPDHGGTTEEFQQVKLAMLVLSDNKRRSHYDRTGEVDDKQSQPDNITSNAMQIIAGIFLSLLSSSSDEYKRINYPKLIADELQSKQRELKQLRQKQVHINRVCIAVSRRLSKTGDSPDVLNQLLTNKRKDCLTALRNIDRDLQTNSKAQELIKEYEYKSEVNLYTQAFQLGGQISWQVY